MPRKGARRGRQARYEWEGSRILRRTVIPSKRRVIYNEDVLIPTDLREWIASPDCQEIRQVLDSLGLPETKDAGDFDRRARAVWGYVVQHVDYRPDEKGQRQLDFWQFPAETLALGRGDCEDASFLLASLLVGSGISPFCVRVVFGSVTTAEGRSAHAWPVYKDEGGVWRLLESTLDTLPRRWPAADDAAHRGAERCYEPDLCLNALHVWTVGRSDRRRRIRDVASYMHSSGRLPDLYEPEIRALMKAAAR